MGGLRRVHRNKKREAEVGLCCHGTSRKGPSQPDAKLGWDLSLVAFDGIWPPDQNMQFHGTEKKNISRKHEQTKAKTGGGEGS